jgi:multiple sugar transport system substrate-binding protein
MEGTRRNLLESAMIASILVACPSFARAQARLPGVTVWVQAGPEAEALKSVAAAYTAATGNAVTVGVQGRAGWRQRYETALAAGSKEFDGVLHISRFVPALAAGGLIAPIDAYVKASADYDVADIPDIIRSEMSYDGRWYMAPTDITLETLVYRKDLIATPPATWDDLVENAKKFTRALNPASPTTYGYAYSAGPGNVMGAFLGIMASHGADFIAANGCVTVDSPAMKTAWSKFIGMKNVAKVTPPDINAWDYPELLVGLQNGTVAQAAFFSAGMPVLLDCAQTARNCNNLAMVAQPAGPVGSRTRVNPLGIMVNAASDKKDALWAFLRFATGPQGAMLYTAAGGQSPRSRILSDAQMSTQRPWLPEMLKASRAGVGTLRIAQSREVAEAFDRFAQQAVGGQITPERSLDLAAAEIRSILGNQGRCA